MTGANLFADKLDQFWTATVTGPQQRQLVQLRPVDDTALCLTLPAAEATGVRLVLARCDGAASQEFMGIEVFFSTLTPYLITTPDSRFCVQAAATGPADIRNIVIAACQGNNRDIWETTVGLVRYDVSQYDELYADSGALEYSMTVSSHGGPGSGIVVERDTQLAAQVWTEVPPGQSNPLANADGSSTLRPLSDESLCLTVPNARYAPGVQLTVQTCDGAMSQEFLRSGTPIANSQELIAFGDGQFCVGEPGAVGGGHPVDLEPCNQHANQAWMQYSDWFGWAGSVFGVHLGGFGGPAITLSSSTAMGGQVGLGPAAAGQTSQLWPTPQGALRSVYNPGLCVDAPSSTAGTQLVAAPCGGGGGQSFLVLPQEYPLVEYELAGSRLCVAATATTSGAAGAGHLRRRSARRAVDWTLTGGMPAALVKEPDRRRLLVQEARSRRGRRAPYSARKAGRTLPISRSSCSRWRQEARRSTMWVAPSSRTARSWSAHYSTVPVAVMAWAASRPKTPSP